MSKFIQILGIFIFCSHSLALNSSKKTASESAENKSILDFASCVKKGQSLDELGICTKTFMAPDLSQDERKSLAYWFATQPQIQFVYCDEKRFKRAKRKYPSDNMSFVCAVNGQGTDSEARPALLVLKKTDGKFQLVNISQ